jgi:hypothetical protein
MKHILAGSALAAVAAGFCVATDASAQPSKARDCTTIGSAFFSTQDQGARTALLREFETTRFASSTQSCAQANPRTHGNMRAALNGGAAQPTPPTPTPTPTPVTPARTSRRPAIVTKTASGGTRCAPDFEYTNYKQFEGRWAETQVHTGYMTFKKTACHLVAWTTALGYYGYDLDPMGLRDKLNDMNGWQKKKTHPTPQALGTLMQGSFRKLSGRAGNAKHNPAMVEAVRKHFCDEKRGEPMIGSVDYEIERRDDDEAGDHFVTIIGFQDGEPMILDPGSSDAPHNRPSGTKLKSNAKVPGGVLLSDVKRQATGRYFLAGVELVE